MESPEVMYQFVLELLDLQHHNDRLINHQLVYEILRLISKYQTIENVYKNLSIIKLDNQSVYQKLSSDQEMAMLSKKLVSLENNLKVDLKFALARIDKFDKSQALEELRALGFVSLIKLLPKNSVKVMSRQSLF